MIGKLLSTCAVVASLALVSSNLSASIQTVDQYPVAGWTFETSTTTTLSGIDTGDPTVVAGRRVDRRDSRQDCRTDEGSVGQDKRECKDDRADERHDDSDENGNNGNFDDDEFREACDTMNGNYSEHQDQYECEYQDGTSRVCDENGKCWSTD